MIYFHRFAFLVLMASFSATATAQPKIGSILNLPDKDTVALFDKLELRVESITDAKGLVWNESRIEKLWRPNHIHLWATFTAPSGKIYTTDGFFYQGYRPTLYTNRSYQACENYYDEIEKNWKKIDHIVADESPGRWMIRFTPNESGTWRYLIHEEDETGSAEPFSGNFICADTHRFSGFARLKDKRYFHLDNGEDYYPLGHNYGWEYDKKQQFCAMFEHLEQAAANKENYMRLLLNSEFSLALVGYNSMRRNMSFNFVDPFDAWMFDSVIEYCRLHHIYIQVDLFHSGAFAKNSDWPGFGWKGNWNRDTVLWLNNQDRFETKINPGGLSTPNEYFDMSNPKVLKNMQDELRYIMARYGYASNIFCWELFGEFTQLFNSTLTQNPVPNQQDFMRWMDSTYRFIKHLDPYKRMIASGVAGNGLSYQKDGAHLERISAPVAQTWNLVDYIQTHTYDYTDLNQINTTSAYTGFAKICFDDAAFYYDSFPDKPYIQGEGGFYPNNTSQDSNGFELHNALWASLFTRAAGAVNYWDFGYLKNYRQFYHFKPVGNFLQQGHLKLSDQFTYAAYIRPKNKSGKINMVYIANKKNNSKMDFDTAYAWIQNDSYNIHNLYRKNRAYLQQLKQEEKPEGVALNIYIPYKGKHRRFRIDWFDTETGDLITTIEKQKSTRKGIPIKVDSERLKGKYGDIVIKVTALL